MPRSPWEQEEPPKGLTLGAQRPGLDHAPGVPPPSSPPLSDHYSWPTRRSHGFARGVRQQLPTLSNGGHRYTGERRTLRAYRNLRLPALSNHVR